MKKLKIAIAGRPNVGKSTLFNRLAGGKLALVHDQPGVTRDWKEAPVQLGAYEFDIMDTPGLSERGGVSLESRMTSKAEEAISKADAVFFVVDAKAGVMPEDKEFARIFRKTGKTIFLFANKCENINQAHELLPEFKRLGFGEPLPISAEHGLGLDYIMDSLERLFEQHNIPVKQQEQPIDGKRGSKRSERRERENSEESEEREDTTPEIIKMAIVGRPNSGKSSLVNWLIGEERQLTGPEAGITRDAASISWNYQGQDYQIIDTAGLRRKARILEQVEAMSAGASLYSIRNCHIALLVLDAACPLENQDLSIANLAISEGRALVIACNKMDTVKSQAEYLKQLRLQAGEVLPQVKGVEIIPISVLKKNGMESLYSGLRTTFHNWNRRLSTSELNRWLEDAISRNAPPIVSGRRIKLKYVSQVRVRPTTLVFFSNMEDNLPESYERYLVNDLRQWFNLPGVPIRVKIKHTENPYKGKRKSR